MLASELSQVIEIVTIQMFGIVEELFIILLMSVANYAETKKTNNPANISSWGVM